jgi:succinate-semialdehyde dehydrogenase/glutarate-semialdehyde dehydrogenase
MTVIPSINPVTGEVFAESPATPPEAVAEAVRAARQAQGRWARRPLAERRQILQRFQNLLFDRREEAARLVNRENGKPTVEAMLTDVAVSLDVMRYYLRHARRILRPQRLTHSNLAVIGKRGWIFWDPVGVVAIIAPWNYPLLLPLGEAIPALLAGNAVVFKPSEFTPRCGLFIAELLHQAGLEHHLFRVLTGAGDVGRALVEAGPDKIFFTGSGRTGRLVARAAAERLIPVNLELGGSDPCIVLADADLNRAASGAIWSRFTNGGQTCVAAKRLIVERRVYDRFLEILLHKLGDLTVGAGDQPGVDMGPMIRESQVRELERQLASTVARGARVRMGGKRRPDLGPTFFEPTVVTDLPLDSPLWREEVFGPVLPVVAVDDEEEAIRIANDSAYGLSASIWTGDRRRGEALARRLESGSILINDATCHVGIVEVPHGGEKGSGLGRTHGEIGMLEMCRPRYVGTDLLDWIRKPWWFGYHAGSGAERDAVIRFLYSPSTWDRIRAIPHALRILVNRRPL